MFNNSEDKNTPEAWERSQKERNNLVSILRNAKRLYYNEALTTRKIIPELFERQLNP